MSDFSLISIKNDHKRGKMAQKFSAIQNLKYEAAPKRQFSNLPREKKSRATLAVNYINILHARFLYKSLFWQIFSSFKPTTQLCNFGAKISYKKCARITLMKLTAAI
jgi:hypothetical protein